DLVEELLRVLPELARRRLVEELRVLPLQLPRVEEELPVDVFAQRLELGLHHAHAGELRRRQVAELEPRAVRARLLDRAQRLALLRGVQVAEPLLVEAVVGVEALAALGIEEIRDDTGDARGVENVDDRLRVRRRDPNRGVLL